MAPIRVVLNCDTANEVDDQFAIAHALGLPGDLLDVRGVISRPHRAQNVSSARP